MNFLKRLTLAVILSCSISLVASEVSAGITPFPGGVSSFGMPILPGVGGNVYSGDVFWVDSGHTQATDGAGGGTKDQPFATIDFAVGQCTANNSDLIIVMPGHVETVSAAAGLDLDVEGITILGIGKGSDRPTIQFTSTTTADMDIDARNVTVINMLFEARVAGLANPIDLNNCTDTSLFNIETRDVADANGVGIGSATNFITTSANSDRLLIDGWVHRGTNTTGSRSPLAALALTGGDDITIRNFNIYGNFDVAGIMATVTSCTRLRIEGGDGSYIWTENGTDTAIAVVGSTGYIGPNITMILEDNAANLTEAATGTSMFYIHPLPVVNAVNEQSATSTNRTPSLDA